jgi:cytidylate kinase
MPVLFISRGTMSGVRMLVDCLQERTGLRIVSREDLVAIVNRHGELATRVVDKLNQADRAYDQFSQLRRPYVVLMRRALLEHVRSGDMVYHGYSGHLLVPTLKHFIRARIDAPLADRVRMTVERLGCDEEAAREYVRGQDERRVRWARFMYGVDIRSVTLYDLNINLQRMTLHAACGILERLMAEPDYQPTSESREQVERLYRAADVEMALVADSRTHRLEISVKFENGNATLCGPYVDEDMLAVVKEIAGAVPAVERVDYTPGYAPYLAAPP